MLAEGFGRDRVVLIVDTSVLVDQYVDLSLGATDAGVIAFAERHGQDTTATLDRRQPVSRPTL